VELLSGVRIASIGPVTSRTVLELGLGIDLEPERFTVEGLVEALIKRRIAEGADGRPGLTPAGDSEQEAP
jgi:uroporphyrinogen-III synthase